mgnify:FL=1
MEEKFNQIKDFFGENPHYAYLSIGIVFLVLAIGHLTNKNWAIDPPNSTAKFNYEIFGHNAYRIVTGILFLIAAIACFIGFFD